MAADQRRPFPHALDAHVIVVNSAGAGVRRQSLPIIGNEQPQSSTILLFQRNPDGPGLRVPDNVVEGLLGDAIDTLFDGGRRFGIQLSRCP
jgi:hypothetical protein